jgi:hypothetical protein
MYIVCIDDGDLGFVYRITEALNQRVPVLFWQGDKDGWNVVDVPD